MRIEEEIKQARFSTEQAKAMVNIMVTADRLSNAIDSILKPFGVSKEQYNVLRILKGQHPNRSPLQLISERMISRSSNATRLVEKLRLKGLIQRTACPENRRKVDILITHDGLDLLEEIAPHMTDIIPLPGSIKTEDAQNLNRILDNLRG